jgi:hypothetical protein
VQEWNIAVRQSDAGEVQCNGDPQTTTSRIRVNTDRTECDETRQAETFAAQCQQAATTAIANLAAEQCGASTKWPQLGGFRQCQHVLRIIRAERDRIVARCLIRWHNRFCNHLND